MEPIRFSGIVSRGLGLGRRLGFPTANVEPSAELPRPPKGVYRASVSWEGSATYAAACSVGTRPTLGEGYPLLIEAHVIGFSGDLYGRELRVSLLEKIRDEEKFESLGALKRQIQKDVERVRSFRAS